MQKETDFLLLFAGLLIAIVGAVLAAWGIFTAMSSHYGWLNNFSGGVWAYIIGIIVTAVGQAMAKKA